VALGIGGGAAFDRLEAGRTCRRVPRRTGTAEFDYLEHEAGMFSLLSQSRKEIADLRRDRGIYIVEDGRINVAGQPSRHTTDFVQAVTEILAKRP
jgi:aspartate/tyrosine/aromatic aminotransferase